MITHLVEKNDKLICHNCKMIQKEIKCTCWFCGYFFSNWEVLQLEKFFEKEKQLT